MAMILERSHLPVRRSELPWALRVGAIGGIVAGLVFAVYEMIVFAAMAGVEGLFVPLRMIGAILLGSEALSPAYSVWAAGLTGVILHLILSALLGMIFGAITGGLRSMRADITLGAVFGFLIWLVNFAIIAPVAFPWLTEPNQLIHFIGHVVFFGPVLGWFVWRSRQRTVTTPGGTIRAE